MKNKESEQFNIKHKEAFIKLGAIATLGWSAFDIKKSSKKMPKVLVTSIWNFHGSKGYGHFAICKCLVDNTLWYYFSKPPADTNSDDKDDTKKWVAHWSSVISALDRGIPIHGFLKDAKSGRCSLSNTFKCGPERREQTDGSFWLQLHPNGEVGCDVGTFVQETPPDRITLVDLQKTFERQLLEASNLDAEKRAERLRLAPKKPETRTATTTVFIRNPDVVAEVLYRAKGVCQKCKKSAPFKRRGNGEPYLEVHHRTRLADDGHDTVENAEALCPNCHRAKHFGET